ncbi:MAG: hypothetical protein KKD64_09900 [Alphaproteobacteria bacterium]|nr:hypothetical protein [Alphaproteobacteria bacterium]MBU0875866.1 hypothetical protein [Alphaproteobacteria bacterium]MBU1769954.1 hypothetical protein [Alphaproteobacteria bacterium]
MTERKKPKKTGGASYSVGYGKPPVETRFPNQTINRAGRKNGAKNWSTLVDNELDEMVIVQEGNQEVTLSKREILIKSLVNKAAKGELKAMELILRLSAVRNEAVVDLDGITPEMLASFARRLASSEGGEP